MTILFVSGPPACKHSTAQTAPKNTVINLNITGEIVKDTNGYIIRGKSPAELFTILNPNPDILDKLVNSGETVTIEAVSVLGDNVNIQKINGKPYKDHQ